MGIHDRDWQREERSGAGRFFSRIFENVENPLGWSLKLFRFGGITTRVHVLLVFYLLAQPLFSINQGAAGFWWMALAMASLFVLVLLHEFGHCFACRRVGGVADRIVLLPWGGLALTMPPEGWRAHFITTVGGPLVNVALVPVFAVAMIALGLGDALVFNPLNPWGVLSSPSFMGASGAAYWSKVAVFMLYSVNLLLLGFNVLLPCFPLDGGRMVQELLWRKRGYRQSMEVATLIGFVGAGAMLIIGLAANQVILVVIAVFCALSCYTERQRVRSEFEIVGDAAPSVFRPDGSTVHPREERERGPSKRELRAQRRAEEDEQTLDALLDKIRDQGMQSLSKKERATLERLSKQRREG